MWHKLRSLAYSIVRAKQSLLSYVRPDYPNNFKPRFEKVRYSAEPESYFDFWSAEGAGPAPLLVYIHGGGFNRGSRIPGEDMQETIKDMRKRGIAFATVEYSKSQHTRSLEKILLSIRYCIQYMRFNAKRFKIDKTRIACFGSSAGAGASLWLATSGDGIDKDSGDPVLHESGKPVAVMLKACQATYNFLRWPEVLAAGEETTVPFQSINECYGTNFKSIDDMKNDAEFFAECERMDMLAMMTENSSPLYVNMPGPEEVQDDADILHHPLHGKAIFDRAKNTGVECCHPYYSKNAPDPFEWLYGKLKS